MRWSNSPSGFLVIDGAKQGQFIELFTCSSAWSKHLCLKQEILGSNPSAACLPTFTALCQFTMIKPLKNKSQSMCVMVRCRDDELTCLGSTASTNCLLWNVLYILSEFPLVKHDFKSVIASSLDLARLPELAKVTVFFSVSSRGLPGLAFFRYQMPCQS